MGRRTVYQRQYRVKLQEQRSANDGTFADAMRKAQRRVLLAAIREEHGNLCAASIRLGIHRNTIGRLLLEVGLTGGQVKEWVRQNAARIERREVGC